jgi:AraC-like DNA-binding protein
VFDNTRLPHFTLSGERHTFYLHYVRQGAVRFQYSGLAGQLIPKDHFQVFYLTADPQTFEFKSSGKRSVLSISFHSEWLEPLAPRFRILANFLDKARTGTPSILFHNPQPLTAENKRLLNDIFLDTWSEDHIKYMVRLILLPALKPFYKTISVFNERFATTEDTIFAVAEWLLLHTDKPVSISFLAQTFLINEFKLKTDFKKHFGMPVITFQRKARVERAKQLLRDPNLSIADIATATGFVHTTYFSDFFRRETGTSPSEYRKDFASTGTASSNSRE